MPMDIALQYFNYIVLSAAETWIGYRLFNTYLSRNKISHYFYYIGVLVYFSFQMFSYINECPMFSTAEYYFIFFPSHCLEFLCWFPAKQNHHCRFICHHELWQQSGCYRPRYCAKLAAHPQWPEQLSAGHEPTDANAFLFILCTPLRRYYLYSPATAP